MYRLLAKNSVVSERLAAECNMAVWQAKQSLSWLNSNIGEGEGSLVDLITRRG